MVVGPAAQAGRRSARAGHDRQAPEQGGTQALKLIKLLDFAELYSLHMANAAWSGARIIMTQTSAESEGIFDLIIATFSSKADLNKLANLDQIKTKSGVSDEEWDAVLAYSAQVSELLPPPSHLRPITVRSGYLCERC